MCLRSAGVSIDNGRTTPKIFYDATTPTVNLAGFIFIYFLQIAIFAKYFATLNFPLDIQSCHPIAVRTLADDRRHGRNFLDADFFCWGGISNLFLEWTPSTNANTFSRYYAHFISTANDSTFTVFKMVNRI